MRNFIENFWLGRCHALMPLQKPWAVERGPYGAHTDGRKHALFLPDEVWYPGILHEWGHLYLAENVHIANALLVAESSDVRDAANMAADMAVFRTCLEKARWATTHYGMRVWQAARWAPALRPLAQAMLCATGQAGPWASREADALIGVTDGSIVSLTKAVCALTGKRVAWRYGWEE